VHDIQRPGREAGIVDDLGEHVGAERRVFRRLPDGGATHGEAIDDRDPGDVDREVPRRDRGHDADRLLCDDDALGVRALLRRGEHLAGVSEHVLGGTAEVVGGVLHHLLARLPDGLADLPRDHLGDLVRALHAQGERRTAELDALEERDLAPGRERLGGGRHRRVDLRRRRGRNRSQRLARRRAGDLDLLAVAGDPLPADIRVLPGRNRHLAPPSNRFAAVSHAARPIEVAFAEWYRRASPCRECAEMW
jgi:hypothetical protein